MIVETVKVKNPKDKTGGFMVINREDFEKDQVKAEDKRQYELHPDEEKSDRAISDRAGQGLVTRGNASGTLDEPTPTDIRFPNKLHTEYEGNLGALRGESAAEHRDAAGMEQRPGGLNPDVYERVREGQAEVEAVTGGDDDNVAHDNLIVAKGGDRPRHRPQTESSAAPKATRHSTARKAAPRQKRTSARQQKREAAKAEEHKTTGAAE
jgi:hypothetical protein